MEVKIVSRKFGIENSHRLEVAKENGGYSSLEIAFSKEPDEITEIVTKSGLRGKGGGGAPTGPKWSLIPKDSELPKYLIVNGDESEPGTFKDREILEKDPHLLIEGMIISAYAIGAKHVYIYIRGEYKFFIDRFQEAVDEAYKSKILGEDSTLKHKIDITVHRGAGAYICGEKSALIESLEGKRGHPRLKPKKPEPEFFFGNPAVVNNVETIASVPYIIEHGAEGYRKYGTEKSPGTMLFALSGHINRGGVYELPFGSSLLDFINTLGGGVKNGKKLKAVIPGGASTPVIKVDENFACISLDYESMRSIGSALGTGGAIVMDEDTDMVEALKNLLQFYHHESCGQCTPCREGTGWSDNIVASILQGVAEKKDLDTLLDIANTMNGKTICVFAPAVSMVIEGFLKNFRDEFEAYIEKGHFVKGEVPEMEEIACQTSFE
jgi:NADH-quinone oxidoreductase subunit F